MSRLQKALTGAAAIQLALVAWTWAPTTSQQADLVALVPVTADQIDTIQVQSPTATADVSLRREGDAWLITSAHDYPADPAKIDALLHKLTQLEVRRPIATQASSHSALNVAADDFARRVSLSGNGDGATIVLGAASGTAAHVRTDSSDDVYAVRGWTAWAIGDQPGRYWDSQVLKLDMLALDTVTITRGDSGFTLVKDQAGWRIAGDDTPLDQGKVDAQLQHLKNLRLSDVVGTGQGPDLASATRVEWTTQDGEAAARSGMNVGGIEDHKATVKVDGQRWIIQVPSSSVESWTTLELVDLQAPKP
jgi:hypothetical protein